MFHREFVLGLIKEVLNEAEHQARAETEEAAARVVEDEDEAAEAAVA